MPFYEYQCKNCGHELEAMQKVSESPLKKCPHCGKSQLQRLMSAPVFRLKGSGWYETDFKGDSDSKRNLADKPETDASKDKDSKSSDTKTDAKNEAKTDSTAPDGAKPAEKADVKSPEKAAKKADRKSARRTRKKVAAKPKKRRR